MTKTLRRALAKEANYRTFGLGVMSLRAFLATRTLTRKSKYVRRYSRKRVCLEYKILSKPVNEYTVWWVDPDTGRERGLDVSKAVYDSYDLPASESGDYVEPRRQRGSLTHLRPSW